MLEQSLDSDGGGEGDLGDGEKALVREMCNVSMGLGLDRDSVGYCCNFFFSFASSRVLYCLYCEGGVKHHVD